MNPITFRPLTTAEQASKVAQVVAHVGCTRATADLYLQAHHWKVDEAVESWRCDHLCWTHEPGFIAPRSMEASD